ncbi:MAG TPA: 50S ribosomal protein L11 methyltransferase, partial [Spirochaetota bacterium]|nr:50S ribosomal protein L11 methyltransferase [Spirochaetota bacterium]
MNVIEKYRLEIKKYSFRDRDILLYQTEDVDEFLDRISNEEYNRDERFPFFIRVWDSGYYLAKYLLEETPISQIEGKRFLELGGGSGIVGIAILLLGGKVIFSDYEEDALKIIDLNCKLNGLNEFKTIKGDWRDFPALDEKIDF